MQHKPLQRICRSVSAYTIHAWRSLFVTALVLVLSSLAWAIEEPAPTPASAKAFRHPDLTISHLYQTVGQLPGQAAYHARQALAALSVSVDAARIDRRGGHFATLLPAQPVIPGTGVGNSLQWEDVTDSPPGNDAARKGAAWKAFAAYLRANRSNLNIDVNELPSPGRVTVTSGGDLVQIYAQRTINGIPVRDSYVNAVINHGNLILFGAQNWGDINLSTEPRVGLDKARAAVAAYLQPLPMAGEWQKAELVIVPLARGRGVAQIAVGQGYDYRLAWVIRPQIAGDLGRWEALVDARSGALLSFEDTNHYAEAVGGVYPVSNDQVAPDGVEQGGWPMPFLNVSTSGGTKTTDTGGNLAPTTSGSLTSSLAGPYILISDNCGPISLTQDDNLDFGTSGGTDCDTQGPPNDPLGGAGNTHSSRTGFYELNRIKEMARGQLPSNTWLQQQLTANMNINQTCNAFWNGSTVNFYRSGGGCSNTGEIAGVFDHEWGHGLDDNDATPGIAGPSGEGIADIYMALRLNSSCIGRGFYVNGTCGGDGDPCGTCTGVRDIDYLNHQSGQPHDYSWSNSTCGGEVHCVGNVYAEAVWSLWKRTLPGRYGYDDNAAHEIVNRLTFLGAGGVGTWFSGGPPYGGCGSSSGYMNYLAVDDDNGDLTDGTPHMSAIFQALDDQEIACNTPTVQDSGCSGAPSTAPAVTATPGDTSVDLDWDPVADASKYQVFRTEGVFACDFGKVKLGETPDTTWTDGGLQNGREYSYVVIPVGADDACMGPASACASATPAAGPGVTITSATPSFTGGDGDAYLDNCEGGTITFTVTNTGLGSLTNVRIIGVTPSNAGVTVTTSFPLLLSPPDLAQGESATGSFSYTAGGLTAGETLIFQVEVTADEMSASKLADLMISPTETDLGPAGTYTFETDDDGWQVVQGTFGRSSSGGGALGSGWYEQSSANLDNQCDQVQSPQMVLNADSTLTLYTNYDIEDFYQPTQVWWDRANVGIHDLVNGVRTPVKPDAGRLYNASGVNGTCGTAGQAGWAGPAKSWAYSSWSSGALNASTYAGHPVQLDIRYGTDESLNGYGFRFDEVTVTDAQVPVADAQSDTCSECGDGTCDGGETPCTCPGDCGTPPESETSCTDGIDNDCNGLVDCADDGCSSDSTCNCGNGTCDTGEDCDTCPDDCGSLTIPGSVCGNGICEAGDGEDCVNCPSDCAGVQSGKPSGRYCCGGGGGKNPVGCGDERCNLDGFLCTTTPSGSGGTTCCGDALCQSPEDNTSCAVDCGGAAVCGNDAIESGEVCDGTDLGSETCNSVTNGEQPYGSLACASDCGSYDTSGCTNAQCGAIGALCAGDSECCSNKCTGKPGKQTCK